MEKLGLTKVSFPQYKGFDEYLDDAGNKIYWDKEKKEWVECVNTDMPMGSRVSSPKQVEVQDRYRERRKQIKAEKRTQECNRQLSFYFV